MYYPLQLSASRRERRDGEKPDQRWHNATLWAERDFAPPHCALDGLFNKFERLNPKEKARVLFRLREE